MEASGDVASNPPVAADNGEAGEAALWREFTVGGSAAARQKLFDLHHAFARQIAIRHFRDRKSGDIELADLFQMACAGLLEALDRYDPHRSVGFRAFARRRISGSILDGLGHMSEMREQLSARNRARAERLKSLTIDNPEQLDAPEAMAALVEMATGLALGFMIEGSGLYVAEDQADTRFSPYDTLAWKQLMHALHDEMAKLAGQEGVVLQYHYLKGLSFAQISRILELSKGRVSQIHKSSLKSLRDALYRGRGFSFEK